MSKLIITHGDYDGVACAALFARRLGISIADLRVIFTQPFLINTVKIPEDVEQIYVCDIAVNNRDPQMTADFITRLGCRLVEWTDHHIGWNAVKTDSRFNIAPTAPACAVILGSGMPPSIGMQMVVEDAIVADTREGTLSTDGQLCEDAMKADLSNDDIRLAVVKFMMGDSAQRPIITTAAEGYAEIVLETERLSNQYHVDDDIPIKYTRADSEERGGMDYAGVAYTGDVAVVDARKSTHRYDLTQLLLKGQELATFAIVKTVSPHTSEEMITVATKSGVNLVELFGLKSGAPFRVSVPIARFDEVIEKLKTHAEPIGQNFGLRDGC